MTNKTVLSSEYSNVILVCMYVYDCLHLVKLNQIIYVIHKHCDVNIILSSIIQVFIYNMPKQQMTTTI